MFGQSPYTIRLSSDAISRSLTPDLSNGNDRYLQLQRQYAGYRLREEKMNTDILSYTGTLGENYTLPVVFHIIKDDPTTVTDQDIINALKDLNDAFQNRVTIPGVQERIREFNSA